MLRSIRESVQSVLKKKRKATVGRIRTEKEGFKPGLGVMGDESGESMQGTGGGRTDERRWRRECELQRWVAAGMIEARWSGVSTTVVRSVGALARPCMHAAASLRRADEYKSTNSACDAPMPGRRCCRTAADDKVGTSL